MRRLIVGLVRLAGVVLVVATISAGFVLFVTPLMLAVEYDMTHALWLYLIPLLVAAWWAGEDDV